MATAQDIRSIFDPVEEAEMEQEPFTLVQGKRRRPRKSSLSDSSSDDESIQLKKCNKPDSAAQTTATRKIATKACKIPPITVFPKGIRMIEINSAFVKECKPEGLKTVKTKDGTRMYTKNSKDYVSLQNFLERKGIPHIIFKLKNDRPVKYVIRGVDDETLPEELLAELKSEGFPAIRVAQLKSSGDKRKLPLFLIEFQPAVDKNKVNGITNIFGMGVRIEPYKTPKTPLQCHNCQRLGHGAQCCSAERRCVKCSLNHLAKECNKTKEEFYCALCGGNHAASYRGCPTYKNRLANKQRNVSSTGKDKSNTETQVKKPPPKKTVGTGQTYAVVASNAHYNTPPQTVEPAPETAPPQAPPIPEPPKPQRPPNRPTQQSGRRRVSARDLDLLLTSDNRVIIAGDLNSKSEMWGCRKTNTTGRILYQHSLDNDYVILAPRTPTHLSNGGLSDILDIALIKGINLNATLEVVNDLNSDHLPVVMNLEGRVTNTTPVKTLNYSKANWNEFREHLDVLLPECPGPWTHKGIDNAVWELTKSIQHAVNMAVPPRTEPKFYQRIPDFIHRLIKDRNRLRRTTIHEIKRLIKHLPSRKTPDPDAIPNLVLKQLSRKALIYLTNIFNSSLAVQYFPAEWKKANIIVFAKPVAMYADATAFLAQSWKPSLVSNRLQDALDKAEAWFSRTLSRRVSMETLEDVAAASSAAQKVATFDSKTEITMLMEVINGIPEFDGHSIDLQEFTFLMLAAHEHLAAASSVLDDVLIRNLYNMLLCRVSAGVRAVVGITFMTSVHDMVAKLKAWYAGGQEARSEDGSEAIQKAEKHPSSSHTGWMLHSGHASGPGCHTKRAVEEWGATEAVYEKVAGEALMAEMPDKIRRQLRDGAQRSLEAALVVVDNDEDDVRATREEREWAIVEKRRPSHNPRHNRRHDSECQRNQRREDSRLHTLPEIQSQQAHDSHDRSVSSHTFTWTLSDHFHHHRVKNAV
ncbi:hypothetical protein AAG570_008508 [Ranatra chinensis]|uniref:Endonuclease/exonuclease/phosphatase domain-containing protein n=1 Tax=Ranatra chinensis TaxID=642074 RepID=A0ABD0YR42_9HEMI